MKLLATDMIVLRLSRTFTFVILASQGAFNYYTIATVLFLFYHLVNKPHKSNFWI